MTLKINATKSTSSAQLKNNYFNGGCMKTVSLTGFFISSALLMIGCNSDNDSNHDATLTEITELVPIVTNPQFDPVLQWTPINIPLTLKAKGMYSDGIVRFINSDELEWQSTNLDVATIKNGIISPKIESITDIVARIKGGASEIRIDDFEVKAHYRLGSYPCADRSYLCLPVIKLTSIPGALITPTPEKSFAESLGVMVNSSYKEGNFMAVEMYLEEANGWCEILNEKNYAGRNNWTIPSKNIFKNWYDDYKDQAIYYNWPDTGSYWTSSPYGNDGHFSVFDMGYGVSGDLNAYPTNNQYVSCVSLR